MIIRDDLSDRLVHLTQGKPKQAADNVLSIIKSKSLLGGTGEIRGDYRCVCFSEAPIAKLGYLLAQRPASGVRYMPYGIMLSKLWLYEQGGRPVIYQPDADYDLLPDSLRYRHVRYEPPDVDFTWEREWRFPGSELGLDPAVLTAIVPDRQWVDKVKEAHREMLTRRAGLGVLGPKSVTEMPWHFLALEDLGVPIPTADG